MMMKKNILTINLALIALILIGNYFYLTVGGLLIKSLCSGGFALLGLINLAYACFNISNNRAFHISMSVGLILAMLGDIVIGKSFVLGAGSFALGHICFIVAYCLLEKPKWLDFAIGGGVFLCAGAFLLLSPLLTFNVEMLRWVCIIYALIISLMLGKAISNFLWKKTILYAIIMLASILFVFSDLMLVFDWFIGLWDWTGEACMGTYYPALCLLAFSSYYYAKENGNEH